MHTYNTLQAARDQLLAARKPFDDALAAIDRAERHCEYLTLIVQRLFEGLNPEWQNGRAVNQWLKSGEFPALWVQGSDIRIDGALTQPNSLAAFLKANMKEGGPEWMPGEKAPD